MKATNEMRTNAVKRISAAVVGLITALVWVTVFLYFSFTIEFFQYLTKQSQEQYQLKLYSNDAYMQVTAVKIRLTGEEVVKAYMDITLDDSVDTMAQRLSGTRPITQLRCPGTNGEAKILLRRLDYARSTKNNRRRLITEYKKVTSNHVPRGKR